MPSNPFSAPNQYDFMMHDSPAKGKPAPRIVEFTDCYLCGARKVTLFKQGEKRICGDCRKQLSETQKETDK